MMTLDLFERAQALTPQLIDWRRDLHQHPELGFEEVRTASIVAEHLRQLGIETITGMGKTGVVGLIEGRSEASHPGPVVLLRFDMDALPISEATGLPFASRVDGRMHACGHDGHTAIGMGVATLLASTADLWSGQIKLLFQPAEEGLGGALATIREGALENPRPDAAFALHLWSQLPLGWAAIQAGPLMAAADHFKITIHGRGGHGAQPQDTVDAVLVGAQVVSALHSIVSRNIPPHETAVLSVCSFNAGHAFNVIAESAVLTGTLRTFQPSVRERLLQRIHEVLLGVTQAHGATYTFGLADHTPATVNDAGVAAVARAAALDLFGPDRVGEIVPMMVAEDMSEFLALVPGCYMLLGAAPAAGSHPHHSPQFDFDEAALPQAVALMAAAAISYSQQKSGTLP